MFSVLCQATLAAAAIVGSPNFSESGRPPASAPSKALNVRPQNPRVLFITADDCPNCEQALERLRRTNGDFAQLQAAGWKIGPGPENHVQIVDHSAVVDLIPEIDPRDFPMIVGIDGQEIVRSFQTGCTTPLDYWTLSWLAKGIDERPLGDVPEPIKVAWTGNFALRGNHWSIDGDFAPTRETLLGHLRGPVHGPQIRVAWTIESWSYEELRSVHDYLHEVEMGGVTAMSRSQQQQRNSTSRSLGSASRKTLGH